MLRKKDGPLIVQSDFSVLLDDSHPLAEEAREKLAGFAELIKRPGVMHTYRITPLSIWNAAASGTTAEEMVGTLTAYGRYGLPRQIEEAVHRLADRYGRLVLRRNGDGTLLLEGPEELFRELAESPEWAGRLDGRTAAGWTVPPEQRGAIKRELVRAGYPVVDLAGYHAGESLTVALRQGDGGFALRDYQARALDLFYRDQDNSGGSGVIVLPCGSGKTVIGVGAIARLRSATLILTSNATSVRQWKRELLDKTTLTDGDIGEYCGARREVRPVTIATYQMMTQRKGKGNEFPHMQLFRQRDWGLIVYDEVHLLPAPVFRMTAEIQATRRLGLTATLIREDGCAEDVFSLIGPKLFEMPWKMLESKGWIASVRCCEIRLPLPEAERPRYYAADARTKVRLAGENAGKLPIVEELLRRHAGQPALVIGQYLDQLHRLGAKLGAPVLTGEVRQEERERLYEAFKRGEIPVLVVSKVANFAVDLPDAAVAIQVSGSFGSRQEEAQRIGRILRPKTGGNAAWFYTLVTAQSKETEFAAKRQLFMLEQGYRYELVRLAEGSGEPMEAFKEAGGR